jgi:two-component system, probable response regulator PhcQ
MDANGRKPSVVIVDDEVSVVTSITALLEVGSEFEVRGFTDPSESVRFIESHLVDVTISDYRMPVMNGLELLETVREIQPESSRLLLTSHADAKSAIDAINRAALFQYIEKPWDDEQLLVAIRSGAERCRLLRELKEKVDALDSAHEALKKVRKQLIEAFL